MNQASKENETQKITIAIEFLNTAADLWINESGYFSAIHLAGAAEEITNKICQHEGKLSFFNKMHLQIEQTMLSINHPYKIEALGKIANNAKNSIKHMYGPSNSSVRIDAKTEAANYIMQAHENFKTLGLSYLLSESVQTVRDANAIFIELDDE